MVNSFRRAAAKRSRGTSLSEGGKKRREKVRRAAFRGEAF